MLSVLSPSKNLDFGSNVNSRKKTNPRFMDEAAQLVETMRKYDADGIKNLMNINDDLASLNEERFRNWRTDFKGSKQALLAFKGDVYFGLEAWSMSERDLTSAQRRIRILSGLYGLLRPMDTIHPYRLEMGLPIETTASRDLYAFWRNNIVAALNEELSTHKKPLLINLASDEYFRAIDVEQIEFPVVKCQFLDKFRGNYRFMSYYGKRARGLMARHIITEKVDNLAGIKRFNLNGYRFDPDRSERHNLVFIRDEVPNS